MEQAVYATNDLPRNKMCNLNHASNYHPDVTYIVVVHLLSGASKETSSEEPTGLGGDRRQLGSALVK